jgi:hypothetical protein
MTWDSGNNSWVGDEAYTRLLSGEGHPSTTWNPALKWVAPGNGTIDIKGNVKKIDARGGSGHYDGVKVKILKNPNTTIWGVKIPKNLHTTIWGEFPIQYDDTWGIFHDEQKVNVKAGDEIYFIIDCNLNYNYDSTAWNPTNNRDRTAWDPTILYYSDSESTPPQITGKTAIPLFLITLLALSFSLLGVFFVKKYYRKSGK